MSKTKKPLFNRFQPESYFLDKSKDIWQLTIVGRKTGPPSHRITLHQNGLKISSAEIQRLDKNPIEFTIERINHLSSFDEVRVHTKEIQYPGKYQIMIAFEGSRLSPDPNREMMPSIDEPVAWEKASFEIKS